LKDQAVKNRNKKTRHSIGINLSCDFSPALPESGRSSGARNFTEIILDREFRTASLVAAHFLHTAQYHQRNRRDCEGAG
jgi:hypothetical protein